MERKFSWLRLESSQLENYLLSDRFVDSEVSEACPNALVQTGMEAVMTTRHEWYLRAPAEQIELGAPETEVFQVLATRLWTWIGARWVSLLIFDKLNLDSGYKILTSEYYSLFILFSKPVF